MKAASAACVGVVSPLEAWTTLSERSDSLMIDVRTRAEWTFVGTPDLTGARGGLALIEWSSFPTMQPNPDFVADALRAVDRAGADTVLFLCRSGARSHAAATATLAALRAQGRQAECLNVAEGFEGDLDHSGRRAVSGGWKARGLPWRQT